MTDYYEQLGVKKNAKKSEIESAYRRLAKKLHPDLASGKESEFMIINEAYDTLKDPVKRRYYDEVKQFKIKIQFKLPKNPEALDFYNYINEVFSFEAEERLIPGQIIVDPDGLWHKITQVMESLVNEANQISLEYRKPQGVHKVRSDEIKRHQKKLSQAALFLCSCELRKSFYDLTLGVEHSKEMRDIEQSIGSKEPLIRLFKKDPRLSSAEGITALKAVNLLTPENFDKLLALNETVIWDLALIVDELKDSNLLTQANFDLLIKNRNYLPNITGGLLRIQKARITNQRYFETLVSVAKRPNKVGITLECLNDLGILNEENAQTVIHKIPRTEVYKVLLDMDTEQSITKAQSKALHWSGSGQIKELTSALDRMVAYGLFLLSCDVEKGKTAMLLALDLKADLKAFFDKPLEKQHATKHEFKKSFIQKLHSKNDIMTMHREYSKVFLANVLIAFTGIGFFAIAINLAINGQIFFAQTKRSQLQDTIEHASCLEKHDENVDHMVHAP